MPVSDAALADCNWVAKLELLAVAVVVGAGACTAAGAANMLCSCAMRERATSKLMHGSHRLSVQRALGTSHGRGAPRHYTRAP